MIVATLVSAMMVTSFFAIALSSRMQTGRANRKLAANAQAARVLEKLRNYVVAPGKDADLDLPGSPDGQLPGDASGQWALKEGVIHDVTSLLASDPNFNGLSAGTYSMTYCVAASAASYTCPGFTAVSPATDCPNYGGRCVQIAVTWTEPSG